MIADLINSMGQENVQGLIVVIVTALLGKNSWDTYKSKDLAQKADLEAHVQKLKSEVDSQLSEARAQLKEMRENALVEVKRDVNEIRAKAIDRLERIETKFSSYEERAEDMSKKLSSIVDEFGKPKVSRAEIRRMKDGN
jgi:F0F1-type ATP synthase membrane subunit b/b'